MFRICMFFSPYLNIFFSPMREPCFVLYFLKNLYDRLLQKKSVNLWAFDSGAIVHPQHPHQEHRPHPQYRPRGPLSHAASPCYPSHVGTCFFILTDPQCCSLNLPRVCCSQRRWVSISGNFGAKRPLQIMYLSVCPY